MPEDVDVSQDVDVVGQAVPDVRRSLTYATGDVDVGSEALAIWRTKLDAFLKERAITTSTDRQCELDQRIEEARQLIEEFEN
jgi:hypothetical protein